MNLLKPSKLREKLIAGKNCSCIKINLSDPRVIEICGIQGIDTVWLCGEHVSNDWLNLENQIRAADIYDMAVFVRVPKGNYSDYIKPLELGAAGIIVPNVKTAREAKEIVNMVRFFPLGHRALDGGNRDGLFACMDIEDYVKKSNESQSIVLQIESREGIKNLDEIAKVEGYDFLFFGPTDYSHELGMPGQIKHDDVVEAGAEVEEAARANGKSIFTVYRGQIGNKKKNNLPKVRVIGSDVVGFGEYISQIPDME